MELRDKIITITGDASGIGAAMERPDFDGSRLNIGGPQRLSSQKMAETLTTCSGTIANMTRANPIIRRL